MANDALKYFRFRMLDQIPELEELEIQLESLISHLNTYFYDSKSGYENRKIFGSYLRRTALSPQSAIDLLYILPHDLLRYIDGSGSQSESRILDLFIQIFRDTPWHVALESLTGTVRVKADYKTSIKIWPVFEARHQEYFRMHTSNWNAFGSFRPHSLDQIFANENDMSGQNLLLLCRSIRHWAAQNQVTMSGFLIDCLATDFIRTSPYRKFSNAYQDCLLRDFFFYLSKIDPKQESWDISGTQEYVYRSGYFEKQAEDAYHAVERLIANSLIHHDDEVRIVMRHLIGAERIIY